LNSIYKITNVITNESYIGETTKTLEQRFKEHCQGRPSLFHDALKKYGKENFTIELLEITEDINAEETWIAHYDTYNNGYNSTKTGKRGNDIKTINPRELKRRQEKANKTRIKNRNNKIVNSKCKINETCIKSISTHCEIIAFSTFLDEIKKEFLLLRDINDFFPFVLDAQRKLKKLKNKVDKKITDEFLIAEYNKRFGKVNI
jgi:group I intron endonuclease